MNKRLQAKDIPERPILQALERCDIDENFLSTLGEIGDPCNLLTHVPAGCPLKVAIAKMASLIRRGLATGCTCGCRGDFEITQAGIDYLGKLRTEPSS